MPTLNIELPETLHEFVDRQVTEGGFRTASAYINALLQEAQKQKTRERIEALLLEGIKSGEPIEVNAVYWEEKHRRLTESHLKANEQ